MCQLNFHDLLYLIVEYDIEAIQEDLKNLERRRLEQRGVEVVDATNEQILGMHRR